ncbi:MAG: gluconeogenesis factor YvcK family protein [Patescibacteria group bacterium]
MKKVTILGGGTGSFVVLSGLKSHPLDIAAIVTMMDSGGSTGRLRDQLGVLPPGDLRQCLVALSDAPKLWRELFLYRFEKGDLEGHNFGNIFLSALQKVCDNYQDVIDTASYVLKTKGKVIPVTFEDTHLCVEYMTGTVLKGESNIDEDNLEVSKIKRAFLEPEVYANQKAIDRILESDTVIIAPGDLYTSLIPILVTKGIKEAIQQSKAKLIYNLNLMNKHGQTTDYTGSEHVEDITRYAGREPDIVVVNSAQIPQNILEWYKTHKEVVTVNDISSSQFKGTVVEADLISDQEYSKSDSDVLSRSILRHDPEKLAKVLLENI